MKALITSALLLLYCCVPVACDFSEHCIYYGTLSIEDTFSSASEQTTNPWQLALCPTDGDALKERATVFHTLKEWSVCLNLVTGQYLAAGMQGDPDLYTIGTGKSGNDIAVDIREHRLQSISGENARLLQDELTDILFFLQPECAICAEDTTYLEISPQSLLQKLGLTLHFQDLGRMAITRIEASLEGLALHKPFSEHATKTDVDKKEYTTRQSLTQGFTNFVQTDSPESFVKDILLLGIHPNSAQRLKLRIGLSSGDNLYREIDLSDLLKGWTSPTMSVELEVYGGTYTTESVHILGWKESDAGTLPPA
jgi:hypothetical protein